MASSKKLPAHSARTKQLSEPESWREASLCFASDFFAHELAIIRALKQLQKKSTTPQTLFDSVEESALKNSFRAFIAIDEVGRGCVAGPVVVAATLWLVRNQAKKNAARKTSSPDAAESSALLKQIQDSKLLDEKKREAIYEVFASNGSLCVLYPKEELGLGPLVKPKACYRFEDLKWQKEQDTSGNAAQNVELLAVAIASASPDEIEKYNIWGATQLGISRALCNLSSTEHSFAKHFDLLKESVLLFDGSLASHVPQSFSALPFVTVVKGDKLLKSVSLSSIFAKVYRDRKLKQLDNELPGYGFAQHKGYGTEMHRLALKKLGATQAHRPSFLRNFLLDQ